MSSPFWTSLPPASPSHISKLLQSPGLSSLRHTANSQWLSNFTLGNVYVGASLVVQTVKRLPTMRETCVQSLGREDPLEKEMATHSSTLAWKTLLTEEPGRLQSVGCKESDPTEWLHFHFQCIYFDTTLRFMPYSPSHHVPMVCSLCLHLHCFPTDRFNRTIFLDSTHMHYYMICAFPFLTYFIDSCFDWDVGLKPLWYLPILQFSWSVNAKLRSRIFRIGSKSQRVMKCS